MSINLSFIDFVVPIARIKEKYTGGFEKFIYDHRRSLGGVDYFDQHLFHTGVMSVDSIERLKERWKALGFEDTEVIDGKEVWKDYCVFVSLLQRTIRPCHWLRVDENERAAYLAGTDPGPVVGRRLYYDRKKTKAAMARYKRDRRRMRWTAVLIYLSKNISPVLVAWLTSWLIRQMQWEPTVASLPIFEFPKGPGD
jgi:hypothetical protein